MKQTLGLHIEKASNGYLIVEETTAGKVVVVVRQEDSAKIGALIGNLVKYLVTEQELSPLPPVPSAPKGGVDDDSEGVLL